MSQLLKGAPVAAALNEKTAAEAKLLAAKGITPTLAIVRIGEKPDDVSYERGAMKRCVAVGVNVRQTALPGDCSQAGIIKTLEGLSKDKGVHGVLLLRPLPKHIDDTLVRNTLAPEKDIDGITDLSLAGVLTGSGEGYPPCTAQACIEVLDYYGIAPAGKRVAVIGRSLVVGKPVALMLLARHATVTVCHTRTVDLSSVCRNAEILVVSAGKAKVVDAGYFSPDQVVIDVGINADTEGNLCGDVDFEAAQGIVAGITPVPGGIGAVTTAVLARHVVESASGNNHTGK